MSVCMDSFSHYVLLLYHCIGHSANTWAWLATMTRKLTNLRINKVQLSRLSREPEEVCRQVQRPATARYQLVI